MAIKSFADTSAVSLAYAFSDAANDTELAPSLSMNLIPFRDEGFTMAKESQASTAITDSRRVRGSKNTKGTASGSVTLEFGAIQFATDMLQAALMNNWQVQPDGSLHIWDSNIKQYLVVEKTMRPNGGATNPQYHERYYGTLVNTLGMELGDGDLITMNVDTMSAFADYDEGIQGQDGLGGSIASAKVVPDDYEIADSSNNLENFILRDENGDPLELTFASASLSIENNVREQPGLGHVFAAGMGMGKVGVSTSAEVYFFDQTILDVHMNNKRMTGEYTIQTKEGKFEFFFPNMVAQSPESSASGENQDYTTSLTLTAEEGVYEGERCCIYIKYTPDVGGGVVVPPTPGSLSADTTHVDYSDWAAAVTGNSVDFSQITVAEAIAGDSVALKLEVGGQQVDLTTVKSITRINPDSSTESLNIPADEFLLVSLDWGQVGYYQLLITLDDDTVVTALIHIVSLDIQ